VEIIDMASGAKNKAGKNNWRFGAGQKNHERQKK
jgi:hypothetical protein